MKRVRNPGNKRPNESYPKFTYKHHQDIGFHKYQSADFEDSTLDLDYGAYKLKYQ